MATLDVSEVIRDPLFTSEVTLIARTMTYDDDGNPVYTDADETTFQAVVTQDSKSLHRYPEAMLREGSIVVRFMVADAPEGFEGKGYDAVEWRGKRFIVKDATDYTQFGQGFIRLLCVPEEVTNGDY